MMNHMVILTSFQNFNFINYAYSVLVIAYNVFGREFSHVYILVFLIAVIVVLYFHILEMFYSARLTTTEKN